MTHLDPYPYISLAKAELALGLSPKMTPPIDRRQEIGHDLSLDGAHLHLQPSLSIAFHQPKPHTPSFTTVLTSQMTVFPMPPAPTVKSEDSPPSYQTQTPSSQPQAPLTGTTRLLKVRYQECHRGSLAGGIKARHAYSCTNRPGLPIAKADIEGYHVNLSNPTAGFLTELLNEKVFEGW